MPDTFVKIASVTVGAGGASSMSFTSIPGTYTDLCVYFSARNTSTGQYAYYRFNNVSTSTYTTRIIYGDGVNPTSITGTFSGNLANIGNSLDSANAFGNGCIYVPNYAGSTAKSSSADSVSENNGTLAYTYLVANVWSGTTAIDRLDLLPTAGNFEQYSTATLYGISKS